MLAITGDTGVYFNIMLKAIQAKRILEIGTSTGYSTLWFADAVKRNNGGQRPIVTIEGNQAKIGKARRNFEEAGVDDIIEVRQGEAINVLEGMQAGYHNAPFDFAFIDADKENAINYFELVYPIVRTGGIIAADNITYPESCVAEMGKYSRYVKGWPGAESVTVPIGHGEEITIKLGP